MTRLSRKLVVPDSELTNRMDRGELFLQPVTLEEAPDYYDVIKEPISWTQIDAKLKSVKYLNVADFKVSQGRSMGS